MGQKLNRYLRKEYWDGLFEEKGFTQHVGNNVDWKFDKPGSFGDTWLWYQKGDFLVGYNAENFLKRRAPALIFSYKPCEYDHTTLGHGFNFRQTFDVLQLINSISDPTLMPLSIHIKWAQEFVSRCLKELSAELSAA